MEKNVTKSVWKFLLVGGFLINLTACNVIKSEQMTVVRDCTGTYLRSNGKDYHVCNKDKSDAFTAGSKVTVSFQKEDGCPSSDTSVVCMMYHENAGWITVKTIK